MATRHMERNKARTCEFCHRGFEAIRWNARFCSPRCRMGYKRWLDSVYAVEHDLDRLIDKLGAYHHTDNQAVAAKAARRMMNRLRYLAEKLEDE